MPVTLAPPCVCVFARGLCVCVCVCVCIYIYTYTHTNTQLAAARIHIRIYTDTHKHNWTRGFESYRSWCIACHNIHTHTHTHTEADASHATTFHPSTTYRVAKIHRIRYDIGHFQPIWPTAEGIFGENDLYYNEAYDTWPLCPCIDTSYTSSVLTHLIQALATSSHV